MALVALAAGIVAIMTWRNSAETAAALPASGAAKGFNVLIVTLDTTRADRIGYHGHRAAATPTLDRLARDGIACMNAVSPVPLTLPAHSSIFTGLDPQHHAVRNNGEYRLDAAHVTLAEILKAQGYDSAAFVSAFVLDARFGLVQGFDT